MTEKTLTLALMNPPYESANSTTAFRIISAALKRGLRVNVFAYEGAVYLPFARQAQHANAVHGRTVEEENHPLPRAWIASLMTAAASHGQKLDWVNCGLCVDERGAAEAIDGVRRGSPADLWNFAQKADNTLVIATR